VGVNDTLVLVQYQQTACAILHAFEKPNTRPIDHPTSAPDRRVVSTGLGSRLRLAREQTGMGLRELAHRVSVSARDRRDAPAFAVCQKVSGKIREIGTTQQEHSTQLNRSTPKK
jgi:hypothetical protein